MLKGDECMKKFIALIMAVVMTVSFVSCGQQAVVKTEEYTRPDLTYWRENLESADADLGIGLSSHGGITTAEEVFALMESIEFYGETSVEPIGGMDDISHSMHLTNRDEDKSINFTFYDDFNYVAIDENGTKVDQSPLYRYSDSEKVKQFFIDKGLYMVPAIRVRIEDKLYNIIKSGDVQQINDKVEPSGKDGSIVTISPAANLEMLEITCVIPVNYGYGCYEASVKIGYDYGPFQRIYYAFIYLDENIDIQTAYVIENVFEGEFINEYIIGDVDYSLWLEKADSSYGDFFRFWLGAGSSAHASSEMEWRTAILRCIRDLSLGQQVEINPKDYPRNQQYRIVLEEGSEYYDENTLVLEFYDDCNYVIICNCQRGGENPVSVCENHTQGYKVNNPEMVRQLFSMDGQYVNPEDYASMEKAVQTYMEKTSAEKLNKNAGGDRKIADGYRFKGNIANFKAENTDHLTMDNGREDYLVDFIAMFTKTKGDGKESYISYHFRMTVYRKGDSWKIDSFYMY